MIRDIEKINIAYEKLTQLKIEPSKYKDSTGRTLKCYELSRMQTLDLMTGYNIELRIKVNRRWEELESNKIDFNNPDTIVRLAQNWKAEQEKRLKAEKKVKFLLPKAELMDRVLDADEKIDIGQAAKILELGYGRNIFFRKLKERGIFFKNRNEPKQNYIEKGYFLLKEKFIERSNHEGFVVLKVLVTQKGLAFLSKIFSRPVSQQKLAVFE